MTKAKHTPGPWRVVEPTLSIEADPHGLIAATRYLGNSDAVMVEHRANANLMSAAPELLEALKVCMAWVNERNGWTDEGYEYGLAKAAVAKAEGMAVRQS